MEPIDKTIEYHKLLMVKDCAEFDSQKAYSFPVEYKVVFWEKEEDIEDWINIHLSTGEFASIERARFYFYLFYDKFKTELKNRLFFVEINGKKIATATISPVNEYGYNCVIDWLAISKDYQGKKLARPLISECLKIARNLGYDKILLHTQTHTWLAAKIYLDFGFDPFLIEEDVKGWQILKTIINHDKLKHIEPLNPKDIYDNTALNVVNNLNKLHRLYNYEIWSKDNMNDVWVSEDNTFHHYKFFNEGKELVLIQGAHKEDYN